MQIHRIDQLPSETAAAERGPRRSAARWERGAGRAAAIAAVLSAVLSPAFGAEPRGLSVNDAVQAALESDPGVESSAWDLASADAKAVSAEWRMMPSLSLLGSYQKLSDLPASSLQIPNPINPALQPLTFPLPASLTDIWTFSANLQYPVFAGFRIREAAELAKDQAQGKRIAAEMVKRSLVFEVRRAYWETLRATKNAETLKTNLELANLARQLTDRQAAEGTATKADLLTAAARATQAEIDLGDAVSAKGRAYLTLSSLTGNESLRVSFSPDGGAAEMPVTLVSDPKEIEAPDAIKAATLDEEALVSLALERRPETRASVISLRAAEHGLRAAQAPLYPTLSLTGNFTYADPNQRVPFQSDPSVFTGTWSLGIALGFDLGGLPAAIADSTAQAKALKKAEADVEKQRKTVTLDVRTCLLALERTRRDLSLVSGMVDQAAEGLRVAREKKQAGTASDLDVLTARLALLRSDFNVANRQIDVQIAVADLLRATATEDIR